MSRGSAVQRSRCMTTVVFTRIRLIYSIRRCRGYATIAYRQSRAFKRWNSPRKKKFSTKKTSWKQLEERAAGKCITVQALWSRPWHWVTSSLDSTRKRPSPVVYAIEICISGFGFCFFFCVFFVFFVFFFFFSFLWHVVVALRAGISTTSARHKRRTNILSVTSMKPTTRTSTAVKQKKGLKEFHSK